MPNVQNKSPAPRYSFEDVFPCKFGDRAKVGRYIDRTTSDYWIDFDTPAHSEEDVRFFISTMARLFGGGIELTIHDRATNEALYSTKFMFNGFVNKDGVDPKTGRPSGHPHIEGAKAREGHLLPSHGYSLHVFRKMHNDSQPIEIFYYGTDDNQVEYVLETEYEPVEMTLAGVKGMFVPSK